MTGQESEEPEEMDIKQYRREHPSGWLQLTKSESIPFLIDALLDSRPEREFNKSELARMSGVSRQSVSDHLPTLLELGILKKVGESNKRYKINDKGPVARELYRLNSAINAVQTEHADPLGENPLLSTEDLNRIESNNPDIIAITDAIKDEMHAKVVDE